MGGDLQAVERFTMIDVRNRATAVALFAKECGFDTKDWGVHRGTLHYNFQFRQPGQEGLTNLDIGTTAREACGRLDLFKRGMVEMRQHLDTERQVKVLSDAVRASVRLWSHPNICTHCQLHALGARASWCDQYKSLLKAWSDGIALAQANHKQKYPISDILKYATSA